MLPIYEVPIYGLILFGYILSTLFIGMWCLKPLNIKPLSSFSGIFWSQLIGTIILSTVFSIIITKGLSFNVGYILIGLYIIYLLYSNKNKVPTTAIEDRIKAKKPQMMWSILAIALVLLFTTKLLQILDWDRGILGRNMIYDKYWYARVADYLIINGTESTQFSKISSGLIDRGVNYYHYFEKWPTATLKFLFGLNSILTDTLITNVFLLYLLFLAYLTFIEAFLPKMRWYYPIAAFGFLFSASIYLTIFTELKGTWLSAYYFIYSNAAIPFFHVKRIVIEIFILGSFTLLYKKKLEYAGALMLCLAVASFATAPAMLTGAFLLGAGMYLGFDKEQNAKMNGLLLSGLSVAIAIYFILLPSLFPNDTVVYPFADMIQQNEPSLIIFHIIILIVRQFFWYLPFSLILIIGTIHIFLKRKAPLEYKIAIASIVGAVSISALLGGLLIEVNWKQIYGIPSYTIFKILFTTLVFIIAEKFWKTEKKYLYIGTIICFLVLGFRTFRNTQLYWRKSVLPYTSNYMESSIATLKKIDKNKPLLCATLEKEAVFNKKATGPNATFINLNLGQYGTYLSFAYNNIDYVTLNWTELDTASTKVTTLTKRHFQDAFIIRFLNSEEGKQYQNASSVEQQLACMKHYKIPVLLLAEDMELPEAYRPYAEAIIKDENTTQTFVKMKYE